MQQQLETEFGREIVNPLEGKSNVVFEYRRVLSDLSNLAISCPDFIHDSHRARFVRS